MPYYRGGPTMNPRPNDVKVDPITGLLRPGRGVSIQDVPAGLERFGGAYELGPIPPELVVVQTGRNPHHYELAPAQPMTPAEYADAVARIRMTPPPTGDADDPSA